MLEFSDAGSFFSEDLDIAKLVKHIIDGFGQAKHKYISLELGNNLPILVGDAEQFETMLHDLIVNALESYATEQGDVFISISYLHKGECEFPEREALHSDSCICIDVQDYGCGMPEEIIDKIFDPFFTTKFTGRGLGLSTAYGIVRRMGGNIAVQSDIDQGTKVSVYLPC